MVERKNPSWKKYVRQVTPYTPGEQSDDADIIKLNTNENPYPPCKGVRDALKDFDYESLRKYPDPAIRELRAEIANYHNVGMENVFVGVGSDDVIAMCYMTFFNSAKAILFPDITYSFYDVWAEEFGVPYEKQPLTDDFRIVESDYYEENGGIIIPNPNAPTGIAEGKDFFRKIVAHNTDSIVIVDEAYVDFGAESVDSLIHSCDNLIVVRTLSKSRSLAGSRIGYALADEELIKAMHDVKYSFNSYTIDRITMKLGVEAIKDEAYFRENVEKIICTKNWTYNKLKDLGFEVFESSSNFLFAKPKGISAADLYKELKARKILVRFFDKPRINEYLRITIGTDDEMAKFIDVVSDILSK
ncbi:MAG: histidinol-phosphate transaminase [Lachnospiraceae bacterium]|nr:histidinol-phosphate transaminase [Lachnospiraceae bacterium]